MLVAKFKLGQVVVTPEFLEKVNEVDQMRALNRHARCDWGIISDEDKLENDNALKFGGRVISVYKNNDGVEFWIITEADRSATTLLLPGDY